MRKARRVLELFLSAGLSRRRIELHLGILRSSVRRVLEQAERANLSWPLPDTVLREMVYGTSTPQTDKPLTQPDWTQVHTALARNRRLTLTQRLNEYREAHPGGYQFSQFRYLDCDECRSVLVAGAHFRAPRRGTPHRGFRPSQGGSNPVPAP